MYTLRIKELREEKNLSVDQLAIRSGLTPQAIYDLETGKTKSPRVHTLKKLSEALGIETQTLIGDAPATTSSPMEAEKEILKQENVMLKQENASLKEQVDRLWSLVLNGQDPLGKYSPDDIAAACGMTDEIIASLSSVGVA